MKRRLLGLAGLLFASALVAAPVYAQHAPPHHGDTAHAPSDNPAADEAMHEGQAGEHGEAAGHGEHGEHGEAAAHGEHAEHGAPKSINWFDFSNKEQPPYGAMLINFVILMAIYVSLGKKPIADALKSRRASVAKDIEEAQRMRKEAEDRAEKYQEKLKHLEEELKDTRAALVEAGKGDKDRIVREAEEKASRMEKDALFLVEQEVKQLRQDLTREAVEIAVSAAEELLRKRVTPVDQERLAEDYLAELASKTKTASIPARAPAAAPQGGQQ